MRSTAARPNSPDLPQLEEIVRRKDDVADEIRADIHEAWAVSWLALHAQESGRADFCPKKNADALYVVLERVASLTEAAKGRLDGPYSGARHAVLNGTEEDP